MEDLRQTTNLSEEVISIFVICEHKMFGHGLEYLLRQQLGNFKVLGHEHNFDKAVTQLQQLQPDIVILYSHNPLAAGARLATQLLEWQPTLHLISISFDDNRLYTHQFTRQEVEGVDDLLAVIRKNSNRA